MKTRAPVWPVNLLGKPFRLGANGPDEFDCWGLVRTAMAERYGVELPALETLRSQTAQIQVATVLTAAPDEWTEITVDETQAGDVLTFRGIEGGVHVGLALDGEWMLHIRWGATSGRDRYRRHPWSGRLIGVHRHREVAECPRA